MEPAKFTGIEQVQSSWTPQLPLSTGQYENLNTWGSVDCRLDTDSDFQDEHVY